LPARQPLGASSAGAEAFALALDGPLRVFVDAVTGKMIELERAEVTYHQAMGATVERGLGAVCVVNPGLPHAAFNAAINLDGEAQDLNQYVHRIETLYARARVHHQFVATPITRPPDLAAAILERGYSLASRRTWLELMGAPPTAPDDPRIEILPAFDAAEWARVVAEGLEAPHAFDLLVQVALRSAKAPNHFLLFATYFGEPAGACEVGIDDGVATIRRLAVRAPFRQRDVARALINAACVGAFARDAFRIITRVFQGRGGERLLESYGFVGMQVSEELTRDPPPFLMD
jgi:GNAT superfamily N-acetyltransferase